MKAAGIESAFGSGPQPGGIVNTRGRVTIGHYRRRMHPALVTPNLYGPYHTQFSALHIINRIFKMLLAALPLPGLHHFIISFRGRHHSAAFYYGIAYRLFNIHIFTRFAGMYHL